MTTTTVRVDIDIHAQAKAAASLRRISLQKMTTTALRYWYPLLDAVRTTVTTEEVTDELIEILKAIDDTGV